MVKTKKEVTRSGLEHQSMLQERARKKAVEEQLADDVNKNFVHHQMLAVDAQGKKLKEQRLKDN